MFLRRQQTQTGNMAYLLAQEEREEREARERAARMREERENDQAPQRPAIHRIVEAVRIW